MTFGTPFYFGLVPGGSIVVQTGLRVRIDDGWFLACLPRSGSGFKFQVRLANTVGVIDAVGGLSDGLACLYRQIRERRGGPDGA